MRDRELPKLEQIMGNKYEKILKRKENHLPALGKLANDMRQNDIQIPDLTSMIEKRVERLKKQYKYIGDDYKHYLLNKLTSSVDGGSKERTHTAPKKTQAYKFLM